MNEDPPMVRPSEVAWDATDVLFGGSNRGVDLVIYSFILVVDDRGYPLQIPVNSIHQPTIIV